jgi:hypothetical protein
VADPLSRQRHSRPSRSGPAETVGGEFSGADLLVHAACPLLFAGNRDQLLAPEWKYWAVCVFDGWSCRSDT